MQQQQQQQQYCSETLLSATFSLNSVRHREPSADVSLLTARSS
jgi:hypothetical protein